MADLYMDTNKRVEQLTGLGYIVTEMWGCDWAKILRDDPAVVAKVQSFNIKTPLCPRDALAGGRTNALKLLQDTIPDQTVIRYYDFKVIKNKPPQTKW